MKNLIEIKNVNHRLGNDSHYFLSPGEISLLFTPWEIYAAKERYERAIRRRPTVDQLFKPPVQEFKPSFWAILSKKLRR